MIQIYVELPNFKRWFTLPITWGEILEHVETEDDRQTLLRLGDDLEIKRYTIWDVEHDEPFYWHQLNEVFRVLEKLDLEPRFVQAFFEHFDVTDVQMLEATVFYEDEEDLAHKIAERAGLMEIYLLAGTVRHTAFYYLDDNKLIRDFLEYGYQSSNDVLFEVL